MKLGGVIFDLDGTLLESMGIWETIGDEYLQTKGLTPPPDLWEKLKALSTPQAAQYFISEFGVQDSADEIISKINTLIEDKYYKLIQFKPSALTFIKKLESLGIRMCIATATDRHLAEAALKRLDSYGYFYGIITCTEVGCGKDRPVIYERALELLGSSKEDTIIFEDALHAVETAKKAGFKVAGVYDASSAGDWEQIRSIADWFINSFDEMELECL